MQTTDGIFPARGGNSEKNTTNDAEGFSSAVDRAISAMPDDFVIKPFLTAHRAEVNGMLLTEYNETEVMELFKEDGRREGRLEGRQEGRLEGRREGRLEGRQEEKRDIALNLYRIGISVDMIAQGTDVSVDTVRQWISESDSEPLAS